MKKLNVGVLIPARLLAAGLLATLSVPFDVAANSRQLALLEGADLADMSLESLMNIEVFSVSKKSEPLQDAASAIFVLTGDDILRSGVKSIPEALRLVPGLTVARQDAHSWIVTARGFSSTLADKLEVLMDGRSLYTPLFSGVYWDMHNILLEDVARIEVIRGPGAALWGSNAVNGVINIVTKDASETEGSVVQVGGGDNIEGFAAARVGMAVGKGHIRVYAQDDHYRDQETRSGADAQDRFYSNRAGFRSDWTLDARNTLTLQGDTFRNRIDQPATTARESNEEDYLLARWVHNTSDSENLELQIYYDRTEKKIPGLFIEDRVTVDLDIRQNFRLGQRHHLVWGGGYRNSDDEIVAPDLNVLTFFPDKRTAETYNIFLQDQFSLIPDRVKLIAGAKLERNDFSGTEFQPSFRFSYTPDTTRTYWGAASRAVRIPTRLDEGFIIFLPAPFPPGTPFIVGSDNFDSEEVIAYEFGYRSVLSNTVSLDVALYYNEYDKLRGVNNSVAPAEISNEGDGDGSGVELALQWHPLDSLRVLASYNYTHLDINPVSGSTDNSIEGADRNDPRHQGMLRVNWKADARFDIDARLRTVSELPDRGVQGYTELDLNLRWRPLASLELGLLAQNLLDRSHPEFSPAVEIQRSVVLSATWRL